MKGGFCLRIAIIDDLTDCRASLAECLQRYFQEYYGDDNLLIDEFESGEQFIAKFSPDSYDLISIDQYMDGLSGMDTAHKIRTIDALTALVFVTKSREHAIDSYGVRASGYLVKPFTYEEFKAAFKLIRLEKIRSARYFLLEEEKILLREILWCDQDGHYTLIHTNRRGVLRIRSPFSELEEILSVYSQFLTCYRGCIVNLEHVERVSDVGTFLLNNGEKISFSQRDRKKIEALYYAWLFRQEREADLL